MSAPARLAAFAALLALVFGAASLAGGAVAPLRGSNAPQDGMAMDSAMGMDAVRGLAVTDGRFALELAPLRLTPGEQVELRFRIRDESGATVRAFDLEHTKRMHLIVVRRDLTGFQHLHPTLGADGTWRVPLAVQAAGTYRVFADFSVDGSPHTLADDLQADGRLVSQPLPQAGQVVSTDGFTVRLRERPTRVGAESALRFAVTRGGRAVTVQDYLGAKGHLVVLRRGDLAYLHVHPDADTLRFDATFPSAGAYRLFLQFKVDGRVHTTAFTQEVAR